jgi:hypothetical protein
MSKLCRIICGLCLVLLASCSAMGQINTKNYGIVVRYQVMPGSAEKNGLEAITDKGRGLFGHAGLRAPSQLGMGGGTSSGGYGIPKWVRVTWRKPIYNERVSSSGKTYETLDFGEIIGDYTVEVASRIPQEVLNYVSQKKGRAIRLAFCMMDDGVLLGWSVQESNGYGWVESMHGGDFKDAEILDGKVIRKGWYINKSGKKIEVN